MAHSIDYQVADTEDRQLGLPLHAMP